MLRTLLLDLLFPKTCVGCGAFGSYVCAKCLNTITFFQSPLCPGCGKPVPRLGVHKNCLPLTSLTGLFALGAHEGILQTTIKRIKYHDQFDMVHFLTSLLITRLPGSLRKVDCVIPVPLHWTKHRDRGFNQSELIAKDLSQVLHIPLCPSLLVRKRATHSQATLKQPDRLKNVAGAFSLNPAALPIPYKTALLVDDVTTTRATLESCAKQLKKAGFRHVFGVTLAHGK